MSDAKSEIKYERLRKIGIGSYGVVFKCVNRQTGQIVAIKRYSENDSDPVIRKIAMREVRMLRQLKHPNLIHLIEVFRRKRILHLVFDYCELTVLDVIEKYGENCPLNLIKKIIWQLVNGVEHCHSHNCIHRDIKPENILINQSGVVKLCDFGFARNLLAPAGDQRTAATINGNSSASGASNGLGASRLAASAKQHEREAKLLGIVERPAAALTRSGRGTSGSGGTGSSGQQLNGKENSECLLADRQALTEYVATRWYRAPELLVGDIYYDIKIDIWAVGCVTAELMRGEPLWPGRTDLDQLAMIMSSLGQMTPAQAHTLLAQNPYDPASIERLLNQVAAPTEPLERKLPARVGTPGLDFVMSCLRMDPVRRPLSGALLQHPYIRSAQMSQFVVGASHVVAQNHSQATAAATFSNSRAQAATSDDQVAAAHARVVQRAGSNSQAILRAANSNQQPASKRLVLVPLDSSPSPGGSSSSTTASSRSRLAAHPSRRPDGKDGRAGFHKTFVPVPIRGISSTFSSLTHKRSQEELDANEPGAAARVATTHKSGGQELTASVPQMTGVGGRVQVPTRRVKEAKGELAVSSTSKIATNSRRQRDQARGRPSNKSLGDTASTSPSRPALIPIGNASSDASQRTTRGRKVARASDNQPAVTRQADGKAVSSVAGRSYLAPITSKQ